MLLQSLCIIFSHWWIQTGVTVRKRPIWVNLYGFFYPCDIQTWQMTLKNNRAPLLWYIKLLHHFNAIAELKLKLRSGHAQFGSKSTIFLAVWPRKLYGWPWKIIEHLFYATSSFVHQLVLIGEFKLELQSGNAQFGSKSNMFLAVWPWNLTDELEKQQAPLLCYFKLCASFRSHWWIQTGVAVRKRPIWVKFDDL